MSIYLGDKQITMGYLGDVPLERYILPQKQPLEIEYIIVAGGGGGAIGTSLGNGDGTGGGGGGGIVTGSVFIEQGIHQIYVGSGGLGGSSSNQDGNQGITSSFYGCVAIGGGAGSVGQQGGNGGSGGGSGDWIGSGAYASGGLELQPSSPCGGLGKKGGGSFDTVSGGGGGGALTQGESGYVSGVTSYAGDGGDGFTWVDGYTYSGGGGGASVTINPNQGAGGNGGTTGGDGSGDGNILTKDGKTYGSGGGAVGKYTSGQRAGNGSQGRVVIRYLGSIQASGGNAYTSGSYTYHEFNTIGPSQLIY